LQQRERDIDRIVAGRIVAQRRYQLQNSGAGERAPRGGGAHHEPAPLALGAGLRREDASTEIAFILE
jgi:hypothetical protein